VKVNQEKYNKPEFDFAAVFEPNDYLYFYGDVLTEQRTQKEIEFLLKELSIDNPMTILDLACGFGRHSNRLAEIGHTVTGIDITMGFLEIAKKQAKKKGVIVDYIQGDMRKISFMEKFDRVILLFTAFGYFEDIENFTVLKNIAMALKPGGLFCFDTFNRDILLKHFLPYIVLEKGNDLMIERNTFDSITGRLYDRRIVIKNGKRKDKPYFIRLYNPTEIRDLLNKAGLELHKIYNNWNAEPFTNNSRRMIIIAKK